MTFNFKAMPAGQYVNKKEDTFSFRQMSGKTSQDSSYVFLLQPPCDEIFSLLRLELAPSLLAFWKPLKTRVVWEVTITFTTLWLFLIGFYVLLFLNSNPLVIIIAWI